MQVVAEAGGDVATDGDFCVELIERVMAQLRDSGRAVKDGTGDRETHERCLAMIASAAFRLQVGSPVTYNAACC